MSWRDRPYSDDDYGGFGGSGGGRPELRLQLRKPSTVVMWIVIINVAVHVIHLIARNYMGVPFERIFGLSLEGLRSFLIWQPFTYMFVHAADSIWHILFNMLLVYFIGSEVERGFGSKRFLQFYITCGLVGGFAYLVFGLIWPVYYYVPIVGASGAAYGLLIAAMIFFPHMQIIFIIFPMPVRVFGALLLILVLFQVLSGNVDNPGGQVCHFGGAMAAVGIFYAWGVMPRVRVGMDFGGGEGGGFVSRWSAKRREGAWARRQKQLAAEQAEVDRILQKVHDSGIASLTRREKNILSTATKRQRERDEKAGRTDRV